MSTYLLLLCPCCVIDYYRVKTELSISSTIVSTGILVQVKSMDALECVILCINGPLPFMPQACILCTV